MLNLTGSEALRLYNTFKITSKTAQEVLAAFEKYCIPKKNNIMKHFCFFSRKQTEYEIFDQYYTDLKSLVASCSFDKKIIADQLLKL